MKPSVTSDTWLIFAASSNDVAVTVILDGIINTDVVTSVSNRYTKQILKDPHTDYYFKYAYSLSQSMQSNSDHSTAFKT